MVKVSNPPRGRPRLSIVWTLSIIASVWATPLTMSLVGDRFLTILVLAYAAAVTGVAAFFLLRPGKIKAPVAGQQEVPESLPQQLA